MSLKEIAKLTGTSVSTVSRVLNNPFYHCQDEKIAERIRQKARDLNYVPNDSARRLKMGNSKSFSGNEIYRLDLLVTRFDSLETDLFFREVFSCLETEFHRRNCIVGKILNIPDISVCKESRPFPPANGLIILGKCPTDLVEHLSKIYPAILAIDRNPTDYRMDEVVCRGTQAATLAVEYLLSLGHTKIAYIGDCNQEARYMGYYECLLTHKIPLIYDYIVATRQTKEEGARAFERMAALAKPPTAVFCANDMTAIGFIEAMHGFNLRKRKNTFSPAIVSIDDIEEASLVSPMLTTVHIPKEEMAHMAVLTIRDRIEGGHRICTRTELASHLVVRESSGFHI